VAGAGRGGEFAENPQARRVGDGAKEPGQALDLVVVHGRPPINVRSWSN
jgi:hypothetical protein